MQRPDILRITVAVCLFILTGFTRLQAQEPKWTPEEQKELFGYCEKPELIKQLKLSPETADKIGEIDHWALLQKISVEANTNEAFATPNEVEEEVVKKYKALRLSADQLKALTDRRQNNLATPRPCAVTTLTLNHQFDTIAAPRALQLYKAQYRKALIDKIGINGRQADMLLETEVWKQKGSLAIGAMPENDFNRVRKTVVMYGQRDKRLRDAGMTDEQLPLITEFFQNNSIGKKP